MSALSHNSSATPAWLDLVRQKVEALRFGQVYIVVHDHQVTQVECLEKTRLAAPKTLSPSADEA